MALTFWRKREAHPKADVGGGLAITPAAAALLRQQGLDTPEDSGVRFEVYGSTYGRMYRRHSAVRAVVDFLARNIAQMKIRKFAVDDEGVSRLDKTHPVQRLLDEPSPGVPRARFMRGVIADRAVYDVAAIWKIREDFDPTPDPRTRRARNDGEVMNLVRLPIQSLHISRFSLAAPLEFTLNSDSAEIVLPASDVIWMPGYAPDSNWGGVPPLETLRQLLAEEWAAAKRQENRWKRGPQLDLVFLQDSDAPVLDGDDARAFKEDWQARYGGVSAPQSGETPLFPPGIKPVGLESSAQSLQYIATRELVRKECCLAYGIQPQLLGITPANFASMDMFHQMLYQDVLTTWTVPIQEEFESQLLREFESDLSRHYLDFNINAKMAGSFLEQAKIGQQAVGGPWMTINEFREKFQGLPPIEDGDRIIIPLNVVRGGGPQANPQDSSGAQTPTLVMDESGQVLQMTPNGVRVLRVVEGDG